MYTPNCAHIVSYSDFIHSAQVNWNSTQLQYTRTAPKRAYYLSMEFLMGRALDNAVLNLGLKDQFRESVDRLGFNFEDLVGELPHPALSSKI